MLHADEVSVNGEAERNSGRQVSDADQVLLDGQEVDTPSERYLMLHKPEGYVCSHNEGDNPTVIGLIELPRAEKLSIAGRLDIDTTGLVLLSDDGQWCHRITSPRHKQAKVYELRCADPIDDKAAEQFARGIMLNNEKALTKPAELELIDAHRARVTLYEGRYHQVKRMFAALGNRVVELHRESIGPIRLDDALFPGEYRELTQAEVQSILNV